MPLKRPFAVLATALVFLFSLYSVVQFMACVSERLAAGSALEPNEDVCLDLIARAGAGAPLYGTPDFQYASSCYPPVYFHASYAAETLTGIKGSFTPARLISILATIATCFLTYFAIRACDLTMLSRLVAVGVFMASYETVDCWYDLVRVDALWLLFLAGAFWIQCLNSTWRSDVGVALLLCLAMLTKQTTLFYLPVFLANGFTRSRRWPALLVAGLPVAALGAAAALNDQMWRYTVTMLGHQDLIPNRIEQFVRLCLPTMIVTVVGILLAFKSGGYRSPLGFRCLLMYGMALGSGVLASLKIGGSVNHFIPFFYFTGVIAGLVLDAARKSLPTHPRWHTAALALIALQCVLLFNLGSRAQRQLKRAEGNQSLVLAMSQLPLSRKPVYCHDVRCNHVVRDAGFNILINAQSLTDLYLSGDTKIAEDVVSSIRHKLGRGEISYALCSSELVEGRKHWLVDHCETVRVVDTGSFGRIAILRVRAAGLK